MFHMLAAEVANRAKLRPARASYAHRLADCQIVIGQRWDSSPFHGGNTGSNPVGDAIKTKAYVTRADLSTDFGKFSVSFPYMSSG